MTAWALALALIVGIYVVGVLEEWSATGRLAPGAPLIGGLAQLARESLVPRQPDRLLFETAPILLLGAGLLAKKAVGGICFSSPLTMTILLRKSEGRAYSTGI